MVCEFYLNKGVKRLGDVIPPSLFFSKMVLVILVPLPFHMNFGVSQRVTCTKAY